MPDTIGVSLCNIEFLAHLNGQGHSMTFVEDHSVSTFSNFLALKPLGQWKPDFMWNLSGELRGLIGHCRLYVYMCVCVSTFFKHILR